MRVSVVVPVYNESASVVALLTQVEAAGLPLEEIIVVDDGSTDGTGSLLEQTFSRPPFILLRHPDNRGKGAALRTGFSRAKGQIIAVQDADLEYDPKELLRVIEPIVHGKADVVFGSRFAGDGPHRVVYFWHMVGNRFLTLLSNVFTNINLSDMETCYKAFRREVLDLIEIEENRFGFEPEITAKVAALGCRIYEVGISYHGRTYEEGKKINWRDGFFAILAILKYNITHRPKGRLRGGS